MKKSLGLLAGLSLFAANGTIINFDTAPLGQTPPGWSASPHWEIRKDQSAPTQPYVLAQISNDPSDKRYPLAILNSLTFDDGDMSVRIKPVAGHAVQGGGLVWRYRDENNYYLARADVHERTVSVYKVQDGRSTLLLPGVRRDIPSNSWSILKISARGNRFQVYMDHRRILQVWDNTFKGPGKVGLWSAGEAVTYFDDFRVFPK
jgi:hypothetical protein